MTLHNIAVIDDDPFVVTYLKKAFLERLPDVEVVGVLEPIAPFAFDVYVVDREFDGESLGSGVIQRVHNIAPESLVLAYSAHLDREFLRGLLSHGCAGAFDKGSIDELQSMITQVEAFFSRSCSSKSPVRGMTDTVLAITGLLKEWNLRLEDNSTTDRAKSVS